MFKDKDGEPESSGEQRKEALQNKIRSLVERAESMRRQLDSGEEIIPMPDDEELSQTNEPFMLSTFKDSWNWDTTNLKPEGHTISPQAQNYEDLSQDVDATKRGEYTLNPETQGLDFEKLRAFVPDLTAFNGKKVHEVVKHVMDTYGITHHVPGIKYWKWMIENPGKTPPRSNLKDGNCYFFPGSVLRDEDGDWFVPYAYWEASEWRRRALWLTSAWSSVCRVALLEK